MPRQISHNRKLRPTAIETHVSSWVVAVMLRPLLRGRPSSRLPLFLSFLPPPHICLAMLLFRTLPLQSSEAVEAKAKVLDWLLLTLTGRWAGLRLLCRPKEITRKRVHRSTRNFSAALSLSVCPTLLDEQREIAFRGERGQRMGEVKWRRVQNGTDTALTKQAPSSRRR